MTALAALALAGCARSLSTPEHNLRVAPPAAWTGGELETRRLESDWWTYFEDAELDRAIAEALEGNHDLRSAAARIETARAEAVVAGAALLPDASVALNRSQQRQNFIGFPIPGGESDVLSTTSTNWGLRLNTSWELDLWGRIRSGEDAAVTGTRVRYAELAAARLSLTGQVAKAWFAALEAAEQVELAESSLASLRLSGERVRARFQGGLRPSLDLRLALTEVARAEAAVAQRRDQRDRAVRQLETLMGRYPAGSLALDSGLPEVPAEIPGGLPSELVHRRPDLVAAELQLVAADAAIAEAQAELRPRFSLTAGTGTASGDLLSLVDNDLFVWNFVGNLIQPLFNNGRLKANVVRNQSVAQEALARYETRLLGAYREVESSLAADATLAGWEQALDDAVTQSAAAESLARERYRLGLTDIITVLSAERTRYESESQRLSLRRARLDNRVDLHIALGGGFERIDVPDAEEARAVN
jgi:NodT family efflux transporter outer membrane factor (OMF) lipoprotein